MISAAALCVSCFKQIFLSCLQLNRSGNLRWITFPSCWIGITINTCDHLRTFWRANFLNRQHRMVVTCEIELICAVCWRSHNSAQSLQIVVSMIGKSDSFVRFSNLISRAIECFRALKLFRRSCSFVLPEFAFEGKSNNWGIHLRFVGKCSESSTCCGKRSESSRNRNVPDCTRCLSRNTKIRIEQKAGDRWIFLNTHRKQNPKSDARKLIRGKFLKLCRICATCKAHNKCVAQECILCVVFEERSGQRRNRIRHRRLRLRCQLSTGKRTRSAHSRVFINNMFDQLRSSGHVSRIAKDTRSLCSHFGIV